MADKTYEVIIVGGEPAGLTAGIYAARAGLKSIILEKGVFGGMITMAERVENFPGFPEGISGIDLGEKLRDQAAKFGLDIESTEVTRIDLSGGKKIVQIGRAHV